MSALDNTWTVAGMTDAGRTWLASLLMRQQRRLVDTQRQLAWSEDSRLALDERIITTQAQIAAMHRSLAMQKQAIDAAQRARQSIAARPVAQRVSTAPAAPLDLRLDDEGLRAYADTEPASFMEIRPYSPAEGRGK